MRPRRSCRAFHMNPKPLSINRRAAWVISVTVWVALFWWCAAVALVMGIASRAFSASSEVLTLPLVPRGSVWRYLDNGSNQGTTWIGLGFNDNSWPSGPARLGYGGDTEVTTVSY